MSKLTALDGRSVADSNFTTFIVPFGYRVRRAGWRGQGGAYLPEDGAPNYEATIAPRRRYLTGETRGIVFGSDTRTAPLFAPLQREVRFFRLDRTLQLRWYAHRQNQGPAIFFDLPATVRLVLFDVHSASREALPSHEGGTCVGFILFRVGATEAMKTADLLDLNEKLRLLSYQYEAQRNALHARNADVETPPEMGKYFGFAVTGLDQRPTSERRDDGSVSLWADLLRLPLQLDGCLQSLDVDLSSYPDDRAFVVSHLCVGDVPWDLSPENPLWKLWHQHLYVESSEAPYRGWLTPLEKQWVHQRTYWRWAESEGDARLYGFSSFSFCTLCAPNAFGLAATHFEAMYLDQLLLVLYQRVAVFNFGRELSALSQEWKRNGWEEVQDKLTQLRAAFGQFVNLYWFPVFTNQVQGLEMYELARRELGNDALFAELRSEMDGTWSFMEAKSAAALNRGGAVLACAGLICAYFGMSLFQQGETGSLHWLSPSLTQVIGFLLCTAVVGIALDWRVYGGKHVCRLVTMAARLHRAPAKAPKSWPR